MKNLPRKYIESMLEAQSQIIAQQQDIEQLKEEKETLTRCFNTYGEAIRYHKKENTKLREEIRILKQYAEIARTDKLHRKGILNDYIRINQQLTDKIVELNG